MGPFCNSCKPIICTCWSHHVFYCILLLYPGFKYMINISLFIFYPYVLIHYTPNGTRRNKTHTVPTVTPYQCRSRDTSMLYTPYRITLCTTALYTQHKHTLPVRADTTKASKRCFVRRHCTYHVIILGFVALANSALCRIVYCPRPSISVFLLYPFGWLYSLPG